MAGEQAHLDGLEGLHRAKHWLDLTTRVGRIWTVQDRPLNDLLHFAWPHGTGEQFSFDLGGTFRGEQMEGQSFLAEVKAYRNESDLPEHWFSFLAKSYAAYLAKPGRCDHLLWISWAPFQARRWDEHRTSKKVRAAALRHRKRLLGESDEAKAANLINSEATIEVARRLWLITLCDQQEDLVPTREHRAWVELWLKREEGRTSL
jgi:hypothetical protein